MVNKKHMIHLTITLHLLAAITTAYAHGDKVADKQTAAPKKAQQHETERHHETHRHASWETPPTEFASYRWDRWDDISVAQRGKFLFQQQCASCHGADGRGTGPAAKGLAHAPADLTQHFHRAPGDGDGYLFWRVTEGGTVEPFRSQNSAMPAFKSVLSEQERWEILTYVHQRMHGGFRPDAGKHNSRAEDEHHYKGGAKSSDAHQKH